MAYILAIDTTLGACSVALLKDGEVRAEQKEVRARGHVERLLPMADEVLKSAGCDPQELDYIAVTKGPGTFAGVRIGLSAAKGMALALDIPIVAITSLEALAFEYAYNNENYSGNIMVAIDARRGEFYMQEFAVLNGCVDPINEAEAVRFEAVTDKLSDKVSVMIGSGTVLLKEIFEAGDIDMLDQYVNPTATMIGLMAFQVSSGFMKSDDVTPLYLRAPDAKLPSKSEIVIIDG